MDLYKDHTMYSVKIGNSSGKLTYVIDQSLTSLKLYDSGDLTYIKKNIQKKQKMFLIKIKKKKTKKKLKKKQKQQEKNK